MRLTKRNSDIILVMGLAAHLVVALLWVCWRGGITWPTWWSQKLRSDLVIALLMSFGAAAIVAVARTAFRFGRAFDRGKTGRTSFRRWDFTVSISVFTLLVASTLALVFLPHREAYADASLSSFTLFTGAASAVAVVGALLLRLAGARRSFTFMVSYSLLAATSCALAFCTMQL